MGNVFQIILLVLTFGFLVFFIVQLFRWIYGLFSSAHRISIVKVIIPLIIFIVLFFGIAYVDYLIHNT